MLAWLAPMPRRQRTAAAAVSITISAVALLGAAPANGAAGRPDLRVSSLSVASSGGLSRATVVVVNGGQSAARANQVSFRYSSSRTSANAAPRRVAKRLRIPRLAADERVTRRITFRRPRGASGRFLFACADGLRQVREGSEANNCRRAGTREGSPTTPPPPPPASPPAPPPPPAAQPIRNYAGTLTTTIRYLNFCGAPVFDETTQIPSTITIGPPVTTAPLSPDLPPAVGGDPNPIRISLGQPTVAGSIARGSIFLQTAQRFGATSPGVVLQYWQLALAGAAVTGTLVQDHREEAAANNLLSHAVELVACRPELGFYNNQSAIAEGATLRGTITDQAVTLHIEGNVTETTRPFVADITANRTS